MIYDRWDEYQTNWESRYPNLHFLGEEWKTSELFIKIIKQYISLNTKVLEIGCGGGKITNLLLEQGAIVTVADVVQSMLDRTNKRFPQVSQYKIESISWEIPNRSFDAVVSYDVFVHFDAIDTFCYLREISRILRIDGIAILHFSNSGSPTGFKEWIYTNNPDLHKLGDRFYGGFGMMTDDVACKMFDACNLEVISHISLRGGRTLFVVGTEAY